MDRPNLPGFDRAYALTLARRAGDIHAAYFNLAGVTFERKEDCTPVTKADLEVQQLVSRLLLRDFPRVSLIAEEGSRAVKGSPWRFIADELDGTDNFRRGIPIYAFMGGLCFQGTPILAAIHDASRQTFMAEVGKGATRNGQPLAVSPATTIRGGTIVVETSPRTRKSLFRLNEEVHLLGGQAIQIYSIGYMAMRVAMGMYDGLIFPGRHLHDCCAPYLILKEAGAVVTDMAGEVPDFSGEKATGLIAAGTAELHAELRHIVERCGG